MSQIAKEIILAVKKQANPQKAKTLQTFFKTGPGEYAEGDLFLGLTVPQQRQIVKEFKDEVKINDLSELVVKPYHEMRLVALLLLVELFQKAKSLKEKQEIVNFYLAHSSYINNWDLVDLSADKIVGQYLLSLSQEQESSKTPHLLINLVKSPLLWERRIAVLATFPYIRAGQFFATLDLAKLLLADQEDLIHKAVGWLLREIGKREKKVLIDFLDQYTLQMPRTMLRYAIEKFPEKERQLYLKKT